jgi:hypothetical protein
MALMRRFLYPGLLAAVLLGSFFFALWQIDKEKEQSDRRNARASPTQLEGKTVLDYSSLDRVAQDAGLRRGQQMSGNIEALTRLNERDVAIAGWLADVNGDATPLELVIFVSGSVAAKIQTKGERPDVTRALNLAFVAEKNVSFGATFQCPAGSVPVFVGLGARQQYFPLPARPCP